MIKEIVVNYLKGIGVGTANIIPGVSGGTIALITGIFERIIDSLKSFDTKAAKLLFSLRMKEFSSHTDIVFLLSVFGGAGSGVLALSFILGNLFENHPEFVWSFFFGLILSSVYFVGRKIRNWNFSTLFVLASGTAAAVTVIAVLDPAAENSSFLYLFLCGIVATCSMILPGLSGSFVLILMGNYELVMIRSVKELDMTVLLPVMAGAGAGLIFFSHLLSWVFKNFRDLTIALLTGFILGSLSLLWPWKNEIITVFENGKEKVTGYDWYLPGSLNGDVIFSLLLMIAGFACIWILENYALDKDQYPKEK